MSADVSGPQADFFRRVLGWINASVPRDDVVVDNGMSAVGAGSGFVARVRGRVTGGARGRGAPAGEGRVWLGSGLRSLGGREAPTARVGLAGGAWRGISGRLRLTREWGERLRRGHGSATRSGVMVTVAAAYRDIATSDFWDSCSSSNTEEYEREEG